MEHATVVDTGLQNQIVQQFIGQSENDIFCIKTELVTFKKDHSFNDIVQTVKGILTPPARAVMPHGDIEVIVYGEYKNTSALILISNSDRHEANDDVYTLSITAFADASLADSLKTEIDELFPHEKMAKVKWWFDGRHGAETKDIYLPPPKTKLLPEFYPTIGMDPHVFMQDFLDGDAGVLLMAGDPGTGKTTLLRHMILEHRLAAHIIYDEKIMEKDSVFQSFLFDSGGDVMIIEDADTILEAREDHGNKLMARFLSVSDGLIKLPNKKLVFTTNISDFRKVDEALLRPGRCYGVVETRPLTLHEAQKAATAAGIPVPMQNKTYTLAELFNPGHQPKVRKIGFNG